jgi:prepilin-type N-terminal cleavage/methylation domain-containing protein
MSRDGRPGDEGFSLVEITVTVALLGTVMASALGAMMAFQRVSTAADHRLRNLEQARVMIAAVTRDLRTATSFTTATAGEVVFLGHLNTPSPSSPPNRIRLYVDAQGRLIQQVTLPDAGSNPTTYNGTPATRVLGTSVVNGTAMFAYRDEDGAQTATLNQIASVDVDLQVRMPSTFAQSPSTLSTSVWLPNVAAAKVAT